MKLVCKNVISCLEKGLGEVDRGLGIVLRVVQVEMMRRKKIKQL